MKIRIKGNSIRYRLTKSDIKNLEREGHLDEKTVFPNGAIFFYCLHHHNAIDEMEADFSDNCITIYIPDHILAQWTGTNIVGFEHSMELQNGEKLNLLIEKDFACIDHTTEDQSDMYVNPNVVC